MLASIAEQSAHSQLRALYPTFIKLPEMLATGIACRPVHIGKPLTGAGDIYPQVGCGPLFYAAQGGHDEVVRFLLDNGANVNAVDSVLRPERF